MIFNEELESKSLLRIGIDVGSTTAKMVVIEEETGKQIFSDYQRHNAQAQATVLSQLEQVRELVGEQMVSVHITGSVGMGFAELWGLPFIQEVVAASKAIQQLHPDVKTMIDIGGEDAKVVFFNHGRATDLRMNGNCAGGTGAFIDQMAIILGVSVDELNELALQSQTIYPIASRCGVFCKTDIQNLIAKNVSREDIAASIFHAVAVQTIVTLAHGCEFTTPLLFCGGPLTFIPALRKAFTDYLQMTEKDVTLPEQGALLPAIGASIIDTDDSKVIRLSELLKTFKETLSQKHDSLLPPVFEDQSDYNRWQLRMAGYQIKSAELKPGRQEVFMGIDSGSTTTKIVVINDRKELLYSFYKPNGGHPIQTVEEGLEILRKECAERNTDLQITGSCSTGYGEDLIKAAFGLHAGIVETMGHYLAAQYLNPDVSFILDIGGQDMKAIFTKGGVIERIEINEACSSGCGSFIETFAKSLGFTPQEFAEEACKASAPCDLGTRCTVFMNSKVKQVLREGATTADIAAGLAYSVVKNCLYKVLKLKDTAELGEHLVVQGGTMRNDAVVRAIEKLTGAEVRRFDKPELMGAFGCALYAMKHQGQALTLEEMLDKANYETKMLHCHGCDNQCLVVRYLFAGGKKYFSGNRCEKIYTNGDKATRKGINAYTKKNELLFGKFETSSTNEPDGRQVIGIPRVLNMYEEFPFWRTLLEACSFKVMLSAKSNYANYEKNAHNVMSDNICFPAKLVHSHIQHLLNAGVSRILMPYVVYERMQTNTQNSYNCPIVTGYAEVVKNVQPHDIPIDTPVITFKDKPLLKLQCREYLKGVGIDQHTADQALDQALQAQQDFEKGINDFCNDTLLQAREERTLTILLAGRPYHSDPLIQHKVADMMSDMGIHVITDDVVRDKPTETNEARFVAQWAYTNRILAAAEWCTQQGDDVQFVELTSFGCGPDAFLTDAVRDVLMHHGKTLTLLKLDDINNVGSMKLRVRSLVESLKMAQTRDEDEENREDNRMAELPKYDKRYRHRKIIAPYFTPYISPLIPAIMRVAGFDMDNLPMSDCHSCDWGLKYANNEVCYPATLVVGDIIKAFKDGKYKPEETAVAITQTGGQCRATNYISLIKKALIDAGYTDVPVISLSPGEDLGNTQPAFKINWLKMLPIIVRAVLFSDMISKFYHAAIGRENEPGAAQRLKDKYLKQADELIRKRQSSKLFDIVSDAAKEFNSVCQDMTLPQVGIVGEIFLKFNPFAHKNITEWLISKGIEVVPPVLSDFFMQTFVNKQINTESHLERKSNLQWLYSWAYKQVNRQIEKMNRLGSEFKYYIPFKNIFEEAENAKAIVTLNAQFGEGWLLPAEIAGYAQSGIQNVVSLQPFGCIANHIVARGVEKKVKALYPQMNLLSLDFDSGVSEVNVINRLLLFIDNLKNKD